jgi:hypothetical protein
VKRDSGKGGRKLSEDYGGVVWYGREIGGKCSWRCWSLGFWRGKSDMIDELRSWAIFITRYGSYDAGNLALFRKLHVMHDEMR